nr:MAG TPA: STAT1 TAZ2 binding domain [Caudoviricetes sp.]
MRVDTPTNIMTMTPAELRYWYDITKRNEKLMAETR